MGVPSNKVDDYPTILEEYTTKIEYDPAHGLLNLEFLPGAGIEESVEIDGIILDYAKDRRVVAIESSDTSARTTQIP